MNKLIELRQEDRIREEASVWVVRLKEGLSDQQERDFAVWLNKLESHSVALIKIATAWDELDIIEQLSSTVRSDSKQDNTDSINWKSLALAASILICVFTVWSVYKTPTPKIEPAAQSARVYPASNYETAIGEHSKVALPDGSIASLNTNSKILVKFSNTERKIELLQGEMLFEVTPDKIRPFVVLAGEVTVRALGTTFNVLRTENNALEILVTKGKVAVFFPVKKSDFIGTIRKTHNEVELSAGEMVTIRGTVEEVTKMESKKIENRLAWTSGMVIFDDKPLEFVIAELNRYTETKIVIGDPDLKQINVAGYFKAGDVDALLYALAENFNISWNGQEGNLIVLQSR